MGKIKEMATDMALGEMLEDACVELAHCTVEAMIMKAMGLEAVEHEEFLASEPGRNVTKDLLAMLRDYATAVKAHRDYVPGTGILRAEYRDGAE